MRRNTLRSNDPCLTNTLHCTKDNERTQTKWFGINKRKNTERQIKLSL